MLSEVYDDTFLVDKDIERDAVTGMEDRVEAQSLFVCKMICFNVGGERIGAVRTIVKIEIDYTQRLTLICFCHFALERCLIPRCRAPCCSYLYIYDLIFVSGNHRPHQFKTLILLNRGQLSLSRTVCMQNRIRKNLRVFCVCFLDNVSVSCVQFQKGIGDGFIELLEVLLETLSIILFQHPVIEMSSKHLKQHLVLRNLFKETLNISAIQLLARL